MKYLPIYFLLIITILPLFGCQKSNKSTTQLDNKSYINHLINSNEILASMILTMNNIVFYQDLMKKIRESIQDNKFDDFYNRYINVI